MKNLLSLKNEDVFKTVLKLDLLLANKKKRYLISGFFLMKAGKDTRDLIQKTSYLEGWVNLI